MEAETTKVIRGTPETGTWFKARLEEIGINQASLARLMISLGDDRTIETIERMLRRMASGEARVSGEMRSLLGLAEASFATPEPKPESKVDWLAMVKDTSARMRDRHARPIADQIARIQRKGTA